MALKRWAIADFVVDTDTLLIEALAGEETVIFSTLISNNETADDAIITISHTDVDGLTVIFSYNFTKTANESPTVVDSAIVLQPGDKIFVKSDKINVSILSSGEAK